MSSAHPAQLRGRGSSGEKSEEVERKNPQRVNCAHRLSPLLSLLLLASNPRGYSNDELAERPWVLCRQVRAVKGTFLFGQFFFFQFSSRIMFAATPMLLLGVLGAAPPQHTVVVNTSNVIYGPTHLCSCSCCSSLTAHSHRAPTALYISWPAMESGVAPPL